MELINATKARENSKEKHDALVRDAVEKLWREVNVEIEQEMALGQFNGFIDVETDTDKEAFESIRPFLLQAGYKVEDCDDFVRISW